MAQIGELLSLGLQARLELERGARTLLELLRERMDGGDRDVRRPSLKERLGFKGFGCCGPTWSLWPTTTTTVIENDDDDVEEDNTLSLSPESQSPIDNEPNPNPNTNPPCVSASQSPGMNLAAALAAERRMRAAVDYDTDSVSTTVGTVPGTPSRVSLMRLLEETTDGYDAEMMMIRREEGGGGGGGCDWVCCVCMGRKKGAAFIPCGHTFCRVCSREMWLNRGACPLCNRPILEILDIY